MLTCFNPKHLAMAGWLLAVAVARAADAPVPAAATDASSSPASGGEISTIAVIAQQPIQDTYTRATWMVIEVDFQGKASARATYINDVSVTLSIAWPNPGATPPVDLPLVSTVHLIGVPVNKKNVAFFFVPPETLARAVKGVAYQANSLPGYFVVQYKVGETQQALGRTDYSSTLNADSAKSFVTNVAGSSALKNLMFSEATVPAYILNQALLKLNGNNFPTFNSPGS